MLVGPYVPLARNLAASPGCRVTRRCAVHRGGSGTDPVVSPSRHNATPCANQRVGEANRANQTSWTGDTSARLWGLMSGCLLRSAADRWRR